MASSLSNDHQRPNSRRKKRGPKTNAPTTIPTPTIHIKAPSMKVGRSGRKTTTKHNSRNESVTTLTRFFIWYSPQFRKFEATGMDPVNPIPDAPNPRPAIRRPATGAGSGGKDGPAREKEEDRQRRKAQSMNQRTAARRDRRAGSPPGRLSADPEGKPRPRDTRPSGTPRWRPGTASTGRARPKKPTRTK